LPLSIKIDPSGKFAYVANLSSRNVSMFAINATTGLLTEIGTPVVSGDGPVSVSIDRTGHFVYVANFISNDVTTFTINTSTGALTTPGSHSAAGHAPFSVITTGRTQQ
jgi:6-phosphogluconolactonase (cycloisomerase 2 family)